jgi:hypothetical protein
VAALVDVAGVKYATVKKFLLSLPDVSEAPHFQYASFRVNNKIFVTVPPDAAMLHVFVPDDVREQALLMYADFVEKLWWGKKVAGLRVLLPKANAAAVKALIKQAWQHKAPRKK